LVTCKICNKKYKQIQASHLRKHGIDNVIEYKELYPKAKTTCIETLRNVSIGTKRGMDNDIVKNKIRYKRTPEILKKLSDSVKQSHKNGVYDGVYTNGERNKKISIGRINWWKTQDTSILKKWLNHYIGSEKHINLCKSNQKKATKAAMRCKVSKPEKEFAEKLKNEGIEFIPQYYVGSFPFDFFIPSKNLLIEIDGKFYHPLTEEECVYDIQRHNFKRDIRKNKMAKELGYNLERIRV
jgi:very-short-patch-repair endonuclease